MHLRRKLAILLALALPSALAGADSVVYVTNYFDQFGTVDLANGSFNPISTLTALSTENALTAGLVPGPGGSLLTLESNGNLDAIDPATGALTVVGATGLGSNASVLAEVGGKLYATDFSGNLYKVNPSTAAATLIGPTGIPPQVNYAPTNPDGSLNLTDESLYGVGGNLYATFDEFSLDPNGYTIDTAPGDVNISPDLYEIDPLTGATTLIGPVPWHLLSTVDVDGTIYAFQGTLNASNSFFATGPYLSIDTLNLTNGDTTFVTSDPNAGPVFAASPAPEPTSLALLGTGLATAIAGRLRKRRAKAHL